MKVITMIFLTLFMAKGCTNEYQNNLEILSLAGIPVQCQFYQLRPTPN